MPSVSSGCAPASAKKRWGSSSVAILPSAVSWSVVRQRPRSLIAPRGDDSLIHSETSPGTTPARTSSSAASNARRVVLWERKKAGAGVNESVHRRPVLAVERQPEMVAFILRHHLPHRWRIEVEVVDLPVHLIAEVMVDVDHRPGQHGIAGALDLGALHGEDAVETVRIIGRQRVGDGHLVRAGNVAQRGAEAVAHLHARLLAHLPDEAL